RPKGSRSQAEIELALHEGRAHRVVAAVVERGLRRARGARPLLRFHEQTLSAHRSGIGRQVHRAGVEADEIARRRLRAAALLQQVVEERLKRAGVLHLAATRAARTFHAAGRAVEAAELTDLLHADRVPHAHAAINVLRAEALRARVAAWRERRSGCALVVRTAGRAPRAGAA